MQYCLNLPIGGQAAHPRVLAEFAAVAEASGWDAVFLEDYIVYQNRQDVPISYEGRHFRVREVTCLPRPVQRPRIPIWIGGAFPNPGPLRRAARWDGACLYKAVQVGSAKDSEEPLTPQEIRELRSFVERHRASSTPFDIVAGGPERRQDSDPERERIRKLAEAGATWFSEWIPPDDPVTMRACIARGPLRIDRT